MRLLLSDFDEVVLATGIKPRVPAIEGIDHPKVLSYIDVLYHKKEVGKKVAVIGAGELVSMFLNTLFMKENLQH